MFTFSSYLNFGKLKSLLKRCILTFFDSFLVCKDVWDWTCGPVALCYDHALSDPFRPFPALSQLRPVLRPLRPKHFLDATRTSGLCLSNSPLRPASFVDAHPLGFSQWRSSECSPNQTYDWCNYASLLLFLLSLTYFLPHSNYLCI
jgi:hypothetical protein